MSPGKIYGELRKGVEWEWDGPCQDDKQHREWEIKALSLGRGERKRRSRLPLSSFHMWTLSPVPQPLISSVCLIAAADTCIDPFLTASRADCPPSAGCSHHCPLCYPPLRLLTFVDVPGRGGCFQKMHLFNNLSSRRGACIYAWVGLKEKAPLWMYSIFSITESHWQRKMSFVLSSHPGWLLMLGCVFHW